MAEESKGPATDRENDPVVDPTANVLDLVESAVKRLDDLRTQESGHVKEIAELRSRYEEKLRKAETDRIDAIRAVDVGNVQRAAEVQSGVAVALDGKVVAAAAAFEERLTATIGPIQQRIDDLSRAQYEAQGQKTQVVETQAKGASSGLWIGLAVAGIGLFLSVVTIGVTIAIVLLTR